MVFEGVQSTAPQLAIGSQPPIHLRKPLRSQPVPAELPLRAHAHQPGVAQDTKVLRHAGLAQAEPVDELADGPLTVT
jgi:hypothetical protein